MASSTDAEYGDDTRGVGRVVSILDGDMYGNAEFRNAAKSLLAPSSPVSPCAGTDDRLIAQQKIVNQQVMKIPPSLREAALADLHGTAEYPTEEPMFMALRLLQMEICLDSMPNTPVSAAYRLCKFLNERYVTNKHFLTMFLRADLYDPQAAAARLALHLTLKLELFGMDLLAKNITLEDLDPESRALIESGYAEPLPMRDQAGRLIMFAKPVPLSRTIAMKAHWFNLTKMVQDDDVSQIRGVVVAFYNIGPDAIVDHRVWRDLSFTMRASPMRVAAHHFFVNGQENAAKILAMRYYMKPENLIRFQPHFDKTIEEFHRDLRRYGLPMEAFVKPGRSEASMVERFQMQYLSLQLYLMRCRALAERQQLLTGGASFENIDDVVQIASAQTNPVEPTAAGALKEAAGETTNDNTNETAKETPEVPEEIPNESQKKKASRTKLCLRYGSFGSTNKDRVHELKPNDVLFGRGQSREHHGNLQVQAKIKELLPAYRASSRSGKSGVAEVAIQFVHEIGGRFLKFAEDDIDDLSSANVGGYVVVPHNMAREKINRFFRKLDKVK